MDAAALGDLYAEDSFLFPDRMDTFEGKEAILGFYHYAFSLLTLKLSFDIDPSRIVVSGDLAFATTTSTGTRLINETQQTVPEINRELWVFRKSTDTGESPVTVSTEPSNLISPFCRITLRATLQEDVFSCRNHLKENGL